MSWHEMHVNPLSSMVVKTSRLVEGSSNLLRLNSRILSQTMLTANGYQLNFPTTLCTFWNFLLPLKTGSYELQLRQIPGLADGMLMQLIVIASPPHSVRRFHVEQQTPPPLFSSLPTQTDILIEHGQRLRTVVRICLDDETAYKPFLGVFIKMPLRDDLKS